MHVTLQSYDLHDVLKIASGILKLRDGVQGALSSRFIALFDADCFPQPTRPGNFSRPSMATGLK